MFLSVEQLVNEIQAADRPDPKAANGLQEGLGGQFGEMRTMMQYLFQNFDLRGKAKPFRDLLRCIATEEIAHVELISTTINMLLEGATHTAESVETNDLIVVQGTLNRKMAYDHGTAIKNGI